MIYYKIRSSQNMFYILNYYEITNRVEPTKYLQQCRKSLIKPINTIKINNNNNNNPSNISHPMHIISLSLFESSKQAIYQINQTDENNIENIKNKLKQSGNIYLLYKTITNVPKSEMINDLIEENGDEIKNYIDPNILKEFNGDKDNNNINNINDLKTMINKLENEKLIICKKEINDDMTYNNLMNKNNEIFKSFKNNKIYIIHI
eukprot:138792_1